MAHIVLFCVVLNFGNMRYHSLILHMVLNIAYFVNLLIQKVYKSFFLKNQPIE